MLVSCTLRAIRFASSRASACLVRWLSTIWGVRLLEAQGSYEHRRVWLWAIIAHLWASRFIAAAKHGLPTRRIDEVYRGTALRGRLLPRPSALGHAAGDDRLVSLTRVRTIDAVIGSILIAAFNRLRDVLGQYGDVANWLPDRGRTLMQNLQHVLGERAPRTSSTAHRVVRYSPITESYRPVVELSLSILNQRSLTSTARGDKKVFGILLDMAEVWELYVAKVLQLGLTGYRVEHTGRTREHFRWLFRSEIDDGMLLGSLRPDIIITDDRERFLAVADAKYKNTKIRDGTLTGVAREDLYQISAYLSGFGEPKSRLDGFLIYPTDNEGEVSKRLTPRSPWILGSTLFRRLWFFSVGTEIAAGQGPILSKPEARMAEAIRAAIHGVIDYSAAGQTTTNIG